MAQFKVKDLMINIMPEGVQEAAGDAQIPCIGFTRCPGFSQICTAQCSFAISCRFGSICPFGTCPGATWMCDLRISICPVGTCPGGTCPGGSICWAGTCVGGSPCPGFSDICGGSIDPTIVVNPAIPLEQLKVQLKQALVDIEQQEELQAKSMQPKSLEEINDLQQRLQGAIEELESQKKQYGGK